MEVFGFARLEVFETSKSAQVVQGFREEFGVFRCVVEAAARAFLGLSVKL